MLEIKNLYVVAGDKEIIRGVSLIVEKGNVVALMGPNGSGKSTLAQTIAGHPSYTVTHGGIFVDGESIGTMRPDQRAKKGVFLSPQHPPDIPGVSIANFLRLAAEAVRGEKKNPLTFHQELKEKMVALGMDISFMTRYVHVGFSGGERIDRSFPIFRTSFFTAQKVVEIFGHVVDCRGRFFVFFFVHTHFLCDIEFHIRKIAVHGDDKIAAGGGIHQGKEKFRSGADPFKIE